MKEALKITAHDYRKGSFNKAILAVGSCECHGDHLPQGTDTLVSYGLAKKVAEQVDGALVLPPITIGYSEHYWNFPFTMSIRMETLIEVLKDILHSVLHNGIGRILIVNGHDGNIAPIEVATRAIKTEHPEARIASLDAWWVTAGNLLPPGIFEVWNGLGHAGEGETSIALHMFGDLCQMEHARGVVPDKLPPDVEIKWLFGELTDCGATGDPTKATAEKGRMMEEVLVKALVRFIKTMDACDWQYNSTLSLL